MLSIIKTISHTNGGDFRNLYKDINMSADNKNTDMENESFSYLLPKSGSRSYSKDGFFLFLS